MSKKIKKLLVTTSIIFTILIPVNPATVYVSAKSVTVYTTETGSKYHKKTCRTLARSKRLYKTTKAKAIKAGYEACKVCKP